MSSIINNEDNWQMMGRNNRPVAFRSQRQVAGRAITNDAETITQHQTAVFGSYVLGDVVAILNAVENAFADAELPVIDCFNYETTAELKAEDTPARRQVALLFEKNRKALQEKNATVNLHYENKRNDILQQKKDGVSDEEDWGKFRRRFTDNMVFFNPYAAQSIFRTKELINAFMGYAQKHLEEDGVVILMWNLERKDILCEISIETVAKNHEFKVIHRLSGEEFSKMTQFTHLKNGNSLDYRSDVSPIISAHKTDCIYMFKHNTVSDAIPAENLIARALVNTVPPYQATK